MMGTQDEFVDDDWTPEERRQLNALARERIPPSELKARVVETLNRRDALATRPAKSRTRVVAIAAAAAIIFVAGTFVGYLAARRSLRAAPVTEHATNEAVANAAQQLPGTSQLRYVVWY